MKTIIYYLILIVLVVYFGSFYKKLMDQKTFLETFANQNDLNRYDMNTIANNHVLRSYNRYNDSYSNFAKQNDQLDSSFKKNKYISFYDTIFNNFFRLKSDTDRIAPEIQRRNEILTKDTNNFKQELSNDSNFLETNKSRIITKYKGQIDSNFKSMDNNNNVNEQNSIVVYEHCNYQGRSLTLGVGTYRYSYLYSNYFNDIISSIKVPPHLSVLAYEHDLSGASWRFNQSMDCIINVGANDTISSIIVERKPIEELPSTVQNMVGYRGNTQKIYSIRIKGTTSGATVWGTDIYTDDSYIPKAAVNAGVIKDGQTKTVYIQMLPAQGSYNGSGRNNVNTAPYSYWYGSYQFVSAPKLSPAENISRSLNNLINQQVNPAANSFIQNIQSNPEINTKLDKLYKEGLNNTTNRINATELSFVQQMNDEVAVALAEKKKNIPNFNIGNNPGILVRIYSSSAPLNQLQLNGTMVNEYVVPAINYFSTSGIDSFFSGKKVAGVYRYLEFLGNLVVPRDTVSIEFKLESAVGSRFYFAGGIVINDFTPNKSVDSNSGLNYVVGGQKVPFKLQVMEGLDNTNNYVMLKWRLNQKGVFVAIPREYYFLPDMNIN